MKTMSFEQHLAADGWQAHRLHPRLVAFRNQMPAGHALADLQQDTLLRAWRKFERFDPERGSFGGWIHQQARDALAELRRQAAARKRSCLVYEGHGPQHVPTAYIDGSPTGDVAVEDTEDDDWQGSC